MTAAEFPVAPTLADRGSEVRSSEPGGRCLIADSGHRDGESGDRRNLPAETGPLKNEAGLKQSFRLNQTRRKTLHPERHPCRPNGVKGSQHATARQYALLSESGIPSVDAFIRTAR